VSAAALLLLLSQNQLHQLGVFLLLSPLLLHGDSGGESRIHTGAQERISGSHRASASSTTVDRVTIS
jgi:hypothetical protein